MIHLERIRKNLENTRIKLKMNAKSKILEILNLSDGNNSCKRKGAINKI